jgi:hypothetical protein
MRTRLSSDREVVAGLGGREAGWPMDAGTHERPCDDWRASERSALVIDDVLHLNAVTLSCSYASCGTGGPRARRSHRLECGSKGVQVHVRTPTRAIVAAKDLGQIDLVTFREPSRDRLWSTAGERTARSDVPRHGRCER